METTGLLVMLPLLLVVAIIGGGWLVPLLVGLWRRRAGRSPKIAYITTGLWAFAALLLAGVTGGGMYWLYQQGQAYAPKPLEHYQGATAQVNLAPGATADLYILAADGNRYHPVITAPGGTVPAGQVQNLSLNVACTDAQGRPWLLSASPPVANLTPGSLIELRADTRLTATVTAQAGGEGQYLFSLVLNNGLGENCTLRLMDGSAAGPRLTVVDAAGSPVLAGTFEYG